MAANDIAALVDELIPGDAEFPSAAAVGVHGLLMFRLRELAGRAAVDELTARTAGLAAQAGVPRTAAVQALEQDHPGLFANVRLCVYLAYYEQPAVIDTLRALGFDYNDAPQPDGYPLAAFDPARDWPEQPRGRWVASGAVGQ